MPTGERKPTFHIYTTGLYSPSFASNFWVCFNIFMTENDWSGYDISIFHHITDREKLDEITMQFLRRYPTEIVRRLLTPEEIIGRPAQFKFLFDCSGMVYNHPSEGLVFDKKYFDKHHIELREGLEFNKHIELFQGMHCPLLYYLNNYMIQIDDGKVLTVYDILVKFNKSRDSRGVIDILEPLQGFEYLPRTISNEVQTKIEQMLFDDEKNRGNMLNMLSSLKRQIRTDFLDELAYVLVKRASIPDGLIKVPVMIMLERLIINMVGSTLGIERHDINEYFQLMTEKHGDAIRSYFQNSNDKSIEYLVESIIDLETQHRR
jgi:hypothetical protein